MDSNSDFKYISKFTLFPSAIFTGYLSPVAVNSISSCLSIYPGLLTSDLHSYLYKYCLQQVQIDSVLSEVYINIYINSSTAGMKFE